MLSRPPIERIAFLGITWYGILILTGILVALWITKREERRLLLPKDAALDFALFAIPLGIIGARLYFVLFRLADFEDEWLRIFNMREGGLAIPGALLGGLLAAWITARRRRVTFLSVCDMAAPGVLLAQAIGRWGNYINVEAYSWYRVSEPAWQFFPLAVEVPVSGVWYWHLATFFYESMWNLAAFVALMLLRRNAKRPGDVFCWYVMLYGVGRVVIEGLRMDSLSFVNEFVRITQVLCALSCVAVAVYYYLRQRSVRRARGAVLHDALLLASVLLGLAACFVGEFERGAYAHLFFAAQLLLLMMLLLNVAVLILRAVRRCRMRPAAAALWLQAALLAVLLLVGLDPQQEGNMIFPTFRQIPCMLQIAACAGVFCFAPFPALRKKRPRPAEGPA